MKYITIIIALFLTTELFAQSDKLAVKAKDYISKSMTLFELNPAHQEISASIEKKFQKMLADFPDCKLDTCLMMRLLIENSETSYEDPQDAYRFRTRRCLIFSMIAMSMLIYDADLFLDLADRSLRNSENKIDFVVTDFYPGFLIFNLFVRDINKSLSAGHLEQLKEEFKKLKTSIAKPIYNQGLQIIESIESK